MISEVNACDTMKGKCNAIIGKGSNEKTGARLVVNVRSGALV